MPLNRWLARPRVLATLAVLAAAAIAAFQLPWSPASSGRFAALVGAPPFDERPAGYTLSGVLLAFRLLGERGLAGYEAYRALDLVFPWLLCGLVAGAMTRVGAARATGVAWLAALVDTAENSAQYAILLTRDDLPPRLVSVASALTQAKFAAYALMLAAVGAVAVRHVLALRAGAREAAP
jgi:hypothetical protein